MTTLLVEQLYESAELEQNFTFNLNKRVRLAAFYPYIYMHNAPVGDFYIGIQKNDGAFYYEKHFTSADIKALMNTEFNSAHVFMPVIPETPILLEKGEYQIFLYAENYVYKRSAFLGWIKQHENLNNEMDYSPSNDAENPLAFRLKVFKEAML